MLPEPPPHPPTALPATSRFPWPAIAVIALGFVLLAAYANTFRVPFLFDDESSIGENSTLRSWKTAFLPPGDSGLTVSGRPLLNASLALNYTLHGENVAGYHVVNWLIHFLGALTLYGLVRRTLELPAARERFGQHSRQLAVAVSALWALHPLQTESVTYIVQRAESLIGLCYLLSLYGFVRSLGTVAAAGQNPAGRRWQLASVAACLAGMASKEVMVSAPLIVFLFDRTFSAGSFARAWRLRRGFYLALASTWVLLAACILASGNRGGTVGVGGDLSPWHYFLTQCRALPHYLRLVVWPHPLVFDYGTGTIHHFSEIAGRFAFLVVLGLGTVFALWKRPAVGFLGVVFFAVLAPTSSVIPVITQTMAEHRMYLALAPLMILLVTLTHLRFGPRLLGLWLPVALGLATLTALRNRDYRDAATLWTHTREHAPLNVRVLNNLGLLHVRADEFSQALPLYRRAVEIAPNDAASWIGYANVLVALGRREEGFAHYQHALDLKPGFYEAHYNFGKSLLEAGRIDDAIRHLQTAVALRPSASDAHYNLGNAYAAAGRPLDAIGAYEPALDDTVKSIDVRNNLANAYVRVGRIDDAITLLTRAVALAPGSAPSRLNLGRALMSAGRIEEGRAAFSEAVRLSPDLAEARANLATSLAQTGRAPEAIPHFEAALKLGLDSLSLRLNYASILAGVGRAGDAVEQFSRAVALAPRSAAARLGLADTLLHAGRTAEAIPHFRALLEIAPDSPDACNNLGIAYAQLGQLADARACFEQALRLRPGFTEARENLDHVLNATR